MAVLLGALPLTLRPVCLNMRVILEGTTMQTCLLSRQRDILIRSVTTLFTTNVIRTRLHWFLLLTSTDFITTVIKYFDPPLTISIYNRYLRVRKQYLRVCKRDMFDGSKIHDIYDECISILGILRTFCTDCLVYVLLPFNT